MATTKYKDKEILWFYWIVAGLPLIIGAIGLLQKEWLPSGLVLAGSFAVLLLGWPLSATVISKNKVVFKGPVRTAAITPETLVSVKVIGARDYRAHIVLRTKYGLPIGYRCRQFENSSLLAQSVLDVIGNSTTVKITPDALRLLQQTAKGSKKPLPIK